MSDSRLVTAARADDDAQYEAGLRPRTLDEYIGQDRVRENLQRVDRRGRSSAARRSITCCSTARPGLGKTTLAYVIANELGVPVRATSGPVLEKPGDLAAILTNLGEREVLFIDEIHRMSPAIEEILYPALEDYELDIMIGQGPSARSVKVPLQQFTLIGATTRAGLLTSPLRARFGIVHRLEFYTPADLEEIVRRSARILGVPIDERRGGRDRAPRRAARRASPTGCCAACATTRRCAPTGHHRATWRARRSSCSRSTSTASTRSIASCCARSSTSSAADRSASNSIAAAISEETDAIEDIYEPFLIQIGFLDRTPRGRVATPRAYEYFGLDAPGRESRLW